VKLAERGTSVGREGARVPPRGERLCGRRAANLRGGAFVPSPRSSVGGHPRPPRLYAGRRRRRLDAFIRGAELRPRGRPGRRRRRTGPSASSRSAATFDSGSLNLSGASPTSSRACSPPSASKSGRRRAASIGCCSRRASALRCSLLGRTSSSRARRGCGACRAPCRLSAASLASRSARA
jgi:hypothetical protein